jgi:hypothetical protein
VIADDVDDFGALPAFAQKLLNDIVVFLRPVDTTAQGPDINEITDKVEGLKFGILEKIQEDARLASAGAKVNIGNPACAITHCHSGEDLSARGRDGEKSGIVTFS